MDPSPEAASIWPYLSISAPIISLLVNVMMQVALVRMRKGSHFLRSCAEAFLAGVAALLFLECCLLMKINSGEDPAMVCFVNFPFYICLSYCFFNFVNLGQSSIRIRIYSEIAANPHGVPVGAIKEEYNESILARMRLQRLLESGDIVKANNGCSIGRKRFVRIGRLIFNMKKILLGKQSEFE